MYDLPLATTRRECLSRQKGRLIQKNGIPLATPRRECLCIGDPSVRVSRGKKGGSFRKRRPIGDFPARVPLGKFFCPAKGSIRMAIRKSIPRTTYKPPGLYRGGEATILLLYL